MNQKKISLYLVFLTFFLDALGATIVFPLFAPLFLSENSSLFSSDISYSSKAALLGFFLAAYPLMQLLISPFIGLFADSQGRKKALLISTFFSCIGYAFCAFAVEKSVLFLLFFSRLLMGGAGSNTTLCLSSIADLSETSVEKTKYYGLGSMLAGFAFIVGPLVGGKLADPLTHPYFNLSFPLWFGSAFSLLNFSLILFFFKETLKQRFKTNEGSLKVLKKELFGLLYAFTKGAVRKKYLGYFFYLISWNMIFLFVPAFLVSNFSAKIPAIGDVCALLGFSWIIGSFFLLKVLIKIFYKKTLVLVSALCVFSLLIYAGISGTLEKFSLALCFCSFFASFTLPIYTSSISDEATKQSQGKTMGLLQSFQSLALIIAPLIISPFISKESIAPFILAGAACLIFIFITTQISFLEK